MKICVIFKEVNRVIYFVTIMQIVNKLTQFITIMQIIINFLEVIESIFKH